MRFTNKEVNPKNLIAKVVALIATFAILLSAGATCFAAPDDLARQSFESLLENVKGATSAVYSVHDTGGNEMDCAKIIANPNGGYLALSHTYLSGSGYFVVSLETSNDLIHWTFVRQLGQYASMPYIVEDYTGGFVVAWESNPNNSDNHIFLEYFSNITNLLNGVVYSTYNAPQVLSTYAEGTPNVSGVVWNGTPGNFSACTVTGEGHFFQNGVNDREMTWSCVNGTWSESVWTQIDNAVLYWNTQEIGQEDYTSFQGFQFCPIEADTLPGNDSGQNQFWQDWDIYCFDDQTGNSDKLSITTQNGSTSFANPRSTYLTLPNGQVGYVFTLFIPSQGAASGEAGPVIYYAPAPAVNNTLAPGTELVGGQSIVSGSDYYTLDMQTDGNLVLYDAQMHALWYSHTSGNSGAYAIMQTDGNLVVYSASNQPLWYSSTGGHQGAGYYLALQNDGNMVIYTPQAQPVWATNTSYNYLDPGHVLTGGESMYSAGLNYMLSMQTDGNLVLSTIQGQVLWSSNTSSNSGDYLIMQTDGNLVIYSAQGSALWNSATNSGNAYMILQNDGNMVVYSAQGQALWATGT